MLDTLLVNGKIYTLVKEGECVAAAGIKDGRIAFVGDDNDLKNLSAKRVIDLDGKTVIPGMGDSHLHFYAYCQTLTQVDLADCTSRAEAFDRLKAAAETTPKGQWIRGANFDQTKWKDAADVLPVRQELDRISRDHPIVLKRVCLHTAVANTMALKIAGIDRNYIGKGGGAVEREADGTPNGVLREQMAGIFDEIIPDALDDVELKQKIMARELRHMAELGMTMIHTYAAEIWKYVENAETYEELDRLGLLPLRVSIYSDKIAPLRGIRHEEEERNDPTRKVQMSGYKLFCDGSLGSRSAALLEPYSDQPESRGILVEDEASLERKMFEAASQGIQCAVHAIGDRAMDIVLTAMEKTVQRLKKEGWTDEAIAAKPFRLIHAQMSTRELVERMERLPLVVDVQPVFMESDLAWVIERIGDARFQRAYPWKTYLNHGLLLAGGSDAPVETFDPLAGIYHCLTHPNQEERLSIYEAVCMFSKNIPYATGDQDYMGTIEAGKFADLAVLDRDIFQTPAEEIRNIKVERTMLAGEDTWIRQ